MSPARGPPQGCKTAGTGNHVPELSAVQLARLILADAGREAAEAAELLVPTVGMLAGTDGELLNRALALQRFVHLVMVRAVIYERQRGASWADIGQHLGISRQSAHERFKDAEQEWFHVSAHNGAPGPADDRLTALLRDPARRLQALDSWYLRRHSDSASFGGRPVSGGLC